MTPPDEQPHTLPQDQEHFIPRGSIVFFLTLILLCLAIWFTIYFIMLHRA